jgi:hypothetical protein
MRVDRDVALAECEQENASRRLASHARKTDEIPLGVRD